MKKFLYAFSLSLAFFTASAMEEHLNKSEDPRPFTLDLTKVETFIKALPKGGALHKIENLITGLKNYELPNPNELNFSQIKKTYSQVGTLKSLLFPIKEELAKETGKEISFLNVMTIQGFLDVLKENGGKDKHIGRANKIIEEEQQRSQKEQQELQSRFASSIESYTQWIKDHGRQPVGLWTRFVYSSVLGVLPLSEGSNGIFLSDEERKEAWTALKLSGLVKSLITDPIGYKYNAQAVLASYLKLTPSPILILGCGRFLSSSHLGNLGIDKKIYMQHGYCQEKHPPSAITINTDLTENPDVYANALDLELWNAVPAGSISAIEDEVRENIFNPSGYNYHPNILSSMVRSLKSDGTISKGLLGSGGYGADYKDAALKTCESFNLEPELITFSFGEGREDVRIVSVKKK